MTGRGMSTIHQNAGSWFWIWILLAFIWGAALGFVTGAGTIITLVTITSYA